MAPVPQDTTGHSGWSAPTARAVNVSQTQSSSRSRIVRECTCHGENDGHSGMATSKSFLRAGWTRGRMYKRWESRAMEDVDVVEMPAARQMREVSASVGERGGRDRDGSKVASKPEWTLYRGSTPYTQIQSTTKSSMTFVLRYGWAHQTNECQQAVQSGTRVRLPPMSTTDM